MHTVREEDYLWENREKKLVRVGDMSKEYLTNLLIWLPLNYSNPNEEVDGATVFQWSYIFAKRLDRLLHIGVKDEA